MNKVRLSPRVPFKREQKNKVGEEPDVLETDLDDDVADRDRDNLPRSRNGIHQTLLILSALQILNRAT